MRHTHYCISKHFNMRWLTTCLCIRQFRWMYCGSIASNLDQHQHQPLPCTKPGNVFCRLKSCFLEPPSPAAPGSSAHWLSRWPSKQPHSPCCLLFRPPCPWPAMHTVECCLCPGLAPSIQCLLITPNREGHLLGSSQDMATISLRVIAHLLLASTHKALYIKAATHIRYKTISSTHGRHLLHGVSGHDAEDDGDARVQAGAQHAAGGRADDSIKVRRGAPDLRAMSGRWTEHSQAEGNNTARMKIACVVHAQSSPCASTVLKLPQAI